MREVINNLITARQQLDEAIYNSKANEGKGMTVVETNRLRKLRTYVENEILHLELTHENSM